MDIEVSEMLKKGRQISLVQGQEKGFFSNLFLVEKRYRVTVQ